MTTNRRITAASLALAAGLFLTGCDDPQEEDTQDPAETSLQEEQDDGDAGDGSQEDGGEDRGEGLGGEDTGDEDTGGDEEQEDQGGDS